MFTNTRHHVCLTASLPTPLVETYLEARRARQILIRVSFPIPRKKPAGHVMSVSLTLKQNAGPVFYIQLLPRELRDEIYSHAILAKQQVHWRSPV